MDSLKFVNEKHHLYPNKKFPHNSDLKAYNDSRNNESILEYQD